MFAYYSMPSHASSNQEIPCYPHTHSLLMKSELVVKGETGSKLPKKYYHLMPVLKILLIIYVII